MSEGFGLFDGFFSELRKDLSGRLSPYAFIIGGIIEDSVVAAFESAFKAHGQRLEADSVAPKPTEASDTTYHELETLPGDIGMCPEVLDIDKLRGRE